MGRKYINLFPRSLGIFLFIFLFLVMACAANAGIETIIAKGITSTANIYKPAINKTNLVWDDNGHIFMYNITTGNVTQITNDPGTQQSPSISGNLIVWQNWSLSGNYNIYMYNITDQTEREISSSGSAKNPTISGNKIVWQEKSNTNGCWTISMYDIPTGKYDLITPESIGKNYDNMRPAISGNRIVWENYSYDTTDQNPVIFMNDTGTTPPTGIQISLDTDGSFYQGVPAISGNKIVWEDTETAVVGSTVEMYQIGGSGVQQDLSDGSSQFPPYGMMAPSIDGNLVVWADYGNTNSYGTIFLNGTDYNPLNPIMLATNLNPIGSSSYTWQNPKISGNRVIWEEENSASKYDLHLFTIDATGTCPTVTFSDNSTSGGNPLTIQFNDTTTTEYTQAHWNWSFGDGSISYEQNPVHMYSTTGQFLVNLTVSDAYCRNLSASKTITVYGPSAPIVQFSGSPTYGLPILNVQFNDASIGSSLLSWNWSFGDNTPWFNTTDSSQKNPSHNYSNIGTYSVELLVKNAYGTGDLIRGSYIRVLNGISSLATIPVSGINVDNRYGGQYMTYSYDNTWVKNPVVKSANSILLTYPPVSTGWQNITFVASDALGFTNTGGENYQGNFSRVYLQTNVTVTGFSSAGSPVNVSYLTDLPTYPTSATIKTEVWESTLSEDNSSLNTIALNSGFTSVNTVAYTANFTRTNIGTNENITVNMSVKDSWVLTTGSTNITAIGIDPSTGNTVGMILNTRRAVTGGTLDYFTADVPSQYGYFSRFVLAQFSGSGNIMQLITLAIGSQMSSQTASSHGSWSPPKASANAAAPAAVQNPAMPQANAAPPAPPAAPPAPPEIPKTANLYINANSVITQATTLQSNDNQATLSIGQGIVAHDPAGKTLSSVSITGMRSSEIPSAPAPKTYIFTGTAYDLQPSGATFSPAIMLTFVTPKAQWGEKYTVQSYDHTTNTWQSLPTTYDPSKGTISAQVSHFCCFALFAKQVAPASTTNAPTSVTPQVTPVPVPPAPTAVSTFLGIILWISETSYGHVYLVATIVIVFIALLFAELRRRRRRQDPLC